MVFEQLRQQQKAGNFGMFGTFLDQQEWELADWLMTSGASQTKVDRFLHLDITRERMGPSYKDNRTLLQKIEKLPQGPTWKCRTITVKGDFLDENGDPMEEELDIWCRDPVECVRELLGNPDFRDAMKYVPERLFSDESEEEEIINEMWTAQWWWDTQTSKRGMILLGYLPVTKLECLHEHSRKGVGFRLFHYVMSILLEPLIEAGKKGVQMTCADWHIRMVYPILAAYIADFPEQCLIVGVQPTDCPICEIDSDDRGEPSHAPFRDSARTLSALKDWVTEVSSAEYTRLGLRPIPKPFWAELPHTDIFSCLRPDLLHQLHKGVFKDHLVKWCLTHAGAAEIDQRFQCMPDHPTLRYFKKGISTITQWTGREFKEMQRIFASPTYGAVHSEVTAVARAVIDFIYYASYPSQSTETLRRLQDALDTFHQHKEIFVKLGIRKHFRIPKIHMMEHYIALIRAKGTPDGFNTELSERLHIDFAKEGYRASNKKNYIEQMVTYLTRRDAIHKFTAFLIWTDAIPDSQSDSNKADEVQEPVEQVPAATVAAGAPTWSIAKRAPWPKTAVRTLINNHGAVDFVPALQAYLNAHVPKGCVTASVYDFVDVYKQIIIDIPSPQRLTDETQRDTIRATPGHPNPGRKKSEPDHFDCVLVHEDGVAEDVGIKGYRAARVRVLFRLPSWFGCTDTLAYIEWCTPFKPPVVRLRMSRVSYAMRQGRRQAAVIPISSIRRSCALTPIFGKPHQRDRGWTARTVLEKCSHFFLNSHQSIYMFQLCDGDFVLVDNVS
ncbi:hypothetical protein JB92DRAFT_3099295 [Gautieria morchelliformis]|nr:hypothetical protein JB92DRAFT_3099295 [Gautieria morchelliformis]